MLTLKQCKTHAYVIAQVMNKVKTFKGATSSINNICNLNVTENDLHKLIKMRVDNYNFDMMFVIHE